MFKIIMCAGSVRHDFFTEIEDYQTAVEICNDYEWVAPHEDGEFEWDLEIVEED